MLVSFIGAKGCGKSTAALQLVRSHGFVRVSMAGGLKDMLRAIGLNHEQLYGNEKEIPCDLLGGKTPRHAMQTLGTEWGRELISDDLWVNVAKHSLQRYIRSDVPVVVDDVRFQNESEVIHELGGRTIRVRRADAEAVPDTHESEAFWRVLPCDIEIDNEGTVNDLHAAVRKDLNL